MGYGPGSTKSHVRSQRLLGAAPQYFSATNFSPFRDSRSSYFPFSARLGSLTFACDTFLNGICLRIWEMQLSRARRLSSEWTMYQGACLLLVFRSIVSRAREYWYQRRYDSRSIGLNFHCRSGSLMRA